MMNIHIMDMIWILILLINQNLNIKDLYFSREKYEVLRLFLQSIIKSKDLDSNLVLSKTKQINKRLYLFILENYFKGVWPSIQSSKNQKQFESQFHKWFDFLKTIKLLKFL